MISLPLDASAIEARRREARLGFYDQHGRRICARCYFRLSLHEQDWRVALTHVPASANTVRDLLVSTVWTGCDPHAAAQDCTPRPFVTAVMDVHTEGGDLTTVRSTTLTEARRTHDEVAQALTDPKTATTLVLEGVTA